MPKRHRITRRARRFKKRRAQTRRIRKQRGGGHKEDLIELITSAQNFDTAFTFFQGMEAPVYHNAFPKKDGETYLVMIVEGEVADDTRPQKLFILTMKKPAATFTEVTLETKEDGVPKDYLDQFPGILLTAGPEYLGIVGATQEIFDVGA